GASQSLIVRLHFMHFAMLGVLCAGLGLAIGVVGQTLLATWLREVVAVALPLPGVVPALHGVAVGLMLFLGFALPPLASLGRAPAWRSLRRERGVAKA